MLACSFLLSRNTTRLRQQPKHNSPKSDLRKLTFDFVGNLLKIAADELKPQGTAEVKSIRPVLQRRLTVSQPEESLQLK